MAMRSRVISTIGLCCSGLCLLALPLLLLWLPPGMGGWLHREALMRWVAAGSLVMYGLGMVATFRHHRSFDPGLLAAAGSLLFLAAAWDVIPHTFTWMAFCVLVVAWLWDRRLLKRIGRHCP
jgi:hypothetical protein